MTISTLADKVILTTFHHEGPGSNGPITRVVIHGTVSPCVDGGAEANAHYFQRADAGGAAHYVVDPAHIVCCVDEDQKASHAPPNAGSIGVELCDPQTGDPDRWHDPDHLAMLKLAGQLVADICARYQLPLVWLSPSDLVAGMKGVTSHANVAQAWRQSDHTDPGDAFPQASVLVPVPPSEEDTVTYTYVQKAGDGTVYVARHGEPPAHVGDKSFGFADAEALAAYQGDRIVASTQGSDVTDAQGQTRKVLTLNSVESQQWFGLG